MGWLADRRNLNPKNALFFMYNIPPVLASVRQDDDLRPYSLAKQVLRPVESAGFLVGRKDEREAVARSDIRRKMHERGCATFHVQCSAAVDAPAQF